MTATLRTLLTALALGSPLAAAAQARVRVVVLDVEPSAPELRSAAVALTGVVLDELGRQPQIAALGSSEMAAMLGMERQRTLLGCEGGTDCLAEMGNAMGAKYVLRGTVSALGKSLRLDLTLLDTARAGAAAREGGTASREEDLESEARSAVRRLAFAVQRPPAGPTPAATPSAPQPPSGGPGPWPWVLTGGGAALLAAGGAGIGWAWSVQAAFDAQQLGNPEASSPTVSRADAARAVSVYPFAWGSAACGAAAVAAGVLWWLLPAPANGPRVTPGPGGAAVRIEF